MSRLTLDDVRDRINGILAWDVDVWAEMLCELVKDIDDSEYTIAETADYLGLTGCWVAFLVKEGVIPSRVIERRAEIVNQSERRIRYADLRAYKTKIEMLS